MSQIAVPVDCRSFLALADFLREKGSSADPVEVVSLAVDYWIDNASWKEELLPHEPRTRASTQGYRWKTLFLPHGTQIRMRYKGDYFYSEVVGDDFVYEGQATSPSAFANKVTQSSRNAWRDLEIKRPQDGSWKLAEILR